MEFLTPGNKTRHKTLLGSLTSIITFAIVLSYATYKGVVWLESTDIQIHEEILENYLTLDDVFTYGPGSDANMCFFAYNFDFNATLDPRYGELKAYRSGWDLNVDSNIGQFSKEIKLKNTPFSQIIKTEENQDSLLERIENEHLVWNMK